MRKCNKYKRIGHWNDKEKLKFSIFMDYYNSVFRTSEIRKNLKIFKCMSEFMKTKNPDQCRSHHQKIKKEFESIEMLHKATIINEGEEKYYFYSEIYKQELIDMEKDITEDVDQNYFELEDPKDKVVPRTDESTNPMNKNDVPEQVEAPFFTHEMMMGYAPFPK